MIREYRNIEEKKDKLQSIKPNLRTDEEKAQMNNLKQKLSRLKKKLITNYPQHHEELFSKIFKKTKTAEEIRAED